MPFVKLTLLHDYCKHTIVCCSLVSSSEWNVKYRKLAAMNASGRERFSCCSGTELCHKGLDSGTVFRTNVFSDQWKQTVFGVSEVLCAFDV